MTEEGSRSAGPDVRQMGGACTSAQLRNITLCSHLNEVHRSLMNLLPRLPAQATANLRCAALRIVETLEHDASHRPASAASQLCPLRCQQEVVNAHQNCPCAGKLAELSSVCRLSWPEVPSPMMQGAAGGIAGCGSGADDGHLLECHGRSRWASHHVICACWDVRWFILKNSLVN